jgi:hypothetical protein
MISLNFGFPFEIISTQSSNQHFNILTISLLTKLDFQRMDKSFKDFAEYYLQCIREENLELSDWERRLVVDSFSELVLNNLLFSSSVLFPTVDIQGIFMKLQVEMLLNGMYFKLLPNVSISLCDIKFHFK